MCNEDFSDSFISMVHAFNPKSGQWNISTIRGKELKRRRNIQAVSDDTGNIYIFGRYAGSSVGLETILFFDNMIILNTNDLT